MQSQLARWTARIMTWTAVVTTIVADSAAAFGHETGDIAGGFISGFTHPLFGADHAVAMVAVGLWGGQLGKPAMWLLPITFPIVMALGGMLGTQGVALPSVEIGIAVSAITLGAMVAFSAKPPLWVAAVIVGLFAVFHGHAHGTELPESATPLAYGVGFVLSTGLLHLLGILIGLLIYWPLGEKFIRICGAVIVGMGSFFLFSHLE